MTSFLVQQPHRVKPEFCSKQLGSLLVFQSFPDICFCGMQERAHQLVPLNNQLLGFAPTDARIVSTLPLMLHEQCEGMATLPLPMSLQGHPQIHQGYSMSHLPFATDFLVVMLQYIMFRAMAHVCNYYFLAITLLLLKYVLQRGRLA